MTGDIDAYLLWKRHEEISKDYLDYASEIEEPESSLETQ